MGSQMSPQMTRLKGCIIRLVAFLQCEFSNVSSNDLLEKRHSHIGYICLTFLHCALSDVFSNCLPVRMQSHIALFVALFSTVYFQMGPQIVCLRACIFTLVAFV